MSVSDSSRRPQRVEGQLFFFRVLLFVLKANVSKRARYGLSSLRWPVSSFFFTKPALTLLAASVV